MNSKSLRRLAADHGSLHTAGLPPNYLFPPSNADPLSDLSSLDVLLAGPPGTPYAKGVWRLHLEIPPTYPTAPPTATFRTRLWHPNVDEATGAVCVETLKRDWSSTLKLRDVLVTISCLLIQPNPASALNEAAGKLASEDWDGFCRRAVLMTDIHAGVPLDIAADVKEAQMRGEDKTVEETVTSEAKKGHEGPSEASAVVKKVQRGLVVDEDEENRRRRGDTVEAESDPESDWIPGPRRGSSPRKLAASRRNIFGIQGLDDRMQIDSSPKKAVHSLTKASSTQNSADDNDDSDPFITVPSKRPAQPSFSLRVPATSTSQLPNKMAAKLDDTKTDTPDLLKFSTQNPFSAIQPNNQQPRLLREFSWSWQDADAIHGAGEDTKETVEKKTEARKRMAGEEFEKKRKWEMKRFKKTGYDLQKYNRGDFGPRVGLGRL